MHPTRHQDTRTARQDRLAHLPTAFAMAHGCADRQAPRSMADSRHFCRPFRSHPAQISCSLISTGMPSITGTCDERRPILTCRMGTERTLPTAPDGTVKDPCKLRQSPLLPTNYRDSRTNLSREHRCRQRQKDNQYCNRHGMIPTK